jgi:hypothetical protein
VKSTDLKNDLWDEIDILTNTIPDSKTWKWSDELRETARGFINICLEEHDGDLKIKMASVRYVFENADNKTKEYYRKTLNIGDIYRNSVCRTRDMVKLIQILNGLSPRVMRMLVRPELIKILNKDESD